MAIRPWLVWLCAAAAALPAQAQQDGPKPGVVASVNGRELTEAEFWRRCERYVGGATDTAVGYVVLREWVQQTILADEAGKKGLLPSPRDVERRERAVRKQLELRGEEFAGWLFTHGRTRESFEEEIRQQLIAENLLTEGIIVSDVDIQLHYTNNKQLFGLPEQVRLSRITVRDRDTARLVDAALKQGRPFEEIARRYSTDRFREAGGRIPEPVEADPRAAGPPEDQVLEKVLRAEVGRTVGPVKVDDYWVFVRLEERLPAKVPELADVQELIAASLKVQKAGPARLKAAQERMSQLHREADLKIHRPEYRHLVQFFRSGSSGPKEQ